VESVKAKLRRAMAAREKAAKAGKAAQSVGSNPYLRRVVTDPELRGSVLRAVKSGRSAYGRFQKSKAPAKTLVEDKRFQRELAAAATAVKEAALTLREDQQEESKKKGRWGRRILLAVAAAGLALVLSENLRTKVLDLLFGAEEEFEYTTVTEPNSTVPEKVAA